MESIGVSELRANLMKILNSIRKGESYKITSRGKVVAKIIPPENSSDNAKQKLKEIGKTAVIGDLISPIDTKWEAATK